MTQRVKLKMRVEGMTCVQCEKIIQKKLAGLEGVNRVAVSYKTGQMEIEYDPNLQNLDHFKITLEKAGYALVEDKPMELPSLGMIAGPVLLASVLLMINRHGGFSFIPEITDNMSYAMLFLAGLLTSLHCVAMCGGINLSQCLPSVPDQKTSAIQPSLLYNGGRVISYTIIGGIVGGLGSVLTLSGSGKGIISLLAGGFMVIMGINLLGLFPGLRRFALIMPAGLRRVLLGKNKDKGPLVVGLLNGLMPCGPLQAMQIYALGTGSALSGALSMFFFSLGTVPLMFLLGSLSTQLSKTFKKRLTQMGAIVVIVLGVIMAERGFALSGISQNISQNSSDLALKAVIEGDHQVVTGNLSVNAYPDLVVQKGIPVTFHLIATEDQLNGCNGSLEINPFGVVQDLKPGDNLMTFVPNEVGTFNYNCWMGMINANITVVEDLDAIK